MGAGTRGGSGQRTLRRRWALLWLAPAAGLVILAAVVLRAGGPSPASLPPSEQGATSSHGPTAATPGSTPTASPDAGALPLGTLTQTAASGEPCPSGADCSGFQVACPGVQAPESGDLAVAPASGQPRGLVVFFSGSEGTNWWSRDGDAAEAFLADLQARGLQVVQVRWRDGWLAASSGERVGPAALACRPATVIGWVHDQLYLPIGAQPGEPAACGFCVTGNSAGGSQVSYALSHFGLETILDAVVPTSGPPHGALVKGCLGRPTDQAYRYLDPAARLMDRSYGFVSRGQGRRSPAQDGPLRAESGPCQRHEQDWRERFEQDGVATGGSDYHHPATRVHFIFGGRDTSAAVAHGRDYVARLRAAGSPLVAVSEVADMGHLVQSSRHGLDDLREALLAES